MITREELLKMFDELETKGIPYTFDHWKKDPNNPPKLPYIVYSVGESYDYYADNKNYKQMYDIDIELYQDSNYYDFEVEEKLKEIFISNSIPFRQNGIIYIETEKMYLTTLTVTVKEKEVQK